MNKVEKIILDEIQKGKKEVLNKKLDPIVFGLQLVKLYEQMNQFNGMTVDEYETFLMSHQG